MTLFEWLQLTTSKGRSQLLSYCLLCVIISEYPSGYSRPSHHVKLHSVSHCFSKSKYSSNMGYALGGSFMFVAMAFALSFKTLLAVLTCQTASASVTLRGSCVCRHGTVGFLKTSNRINVMLSRAKHGMYILGHADTLTAHKKSAMWPQVCSLCIAAPLMAHYALLPGQTSCDSHN